MLSYPLLMQSFREIRKNFLIFAALMLGGTALWFGIYHPGITDTLQALTASLSTQMLVAFGLDFSRGSLTEFVSFGLFGFFLLILPLGYEVMAASQLIASGIDSGIFVYLIATPNARATIACTRGACLAGSTGLLFLLTGICGEICAAVQFPGQLDEPVFWQLLAGCFFLHALLGGIAFFAACRGKNMRTFVLAGAGIPVAFLLLHMLAATGGMWGILRFGTVFTLFDIEAILAGEGICFLYMALLCAGAVVLYALGVNSFRKRDLAI